MSTLGVHPDQLILDLLAIADDETLAGQLADHRDRPVGDGAARLLVAIVRGGLDPTAIRPAAALALELDDGARRTDSRVAR